MFPAGGLDQPIRGVVRVVTIRVDALVEKVTRLLRVVTDPRDVADRVICIPCVLHRAARPAGRSNLRAVVGECHAVAPGEQASDPEGQRVVLVRGPDAVAVVDRSALTFGVIVDVGHEGRRHRGVPHVCLDTL